jgi:hypothetical protein
MGKKILKISLIVFLVIILFLIAVPFLFKGKIVERIKTEANKHLNANLNFNNNIGLNLFKNFPNLSVTLTDLCITGKGEFEGDTLLYSKETNVVVDLKTLWNTKEIPLRKLYANEPYINVIILKDGKANYDITIPSADTTTSQLKMKFDVYEMKNGRLNFVDESNGFYTHLTGLDHLGSGNFADMVFDLKTKTDIKDLTVGYGSMVFLDHVKAGADAVLHMDLNKYRFEFKNNIISLNEMPIAFNGFVSLPNATDIDMDLTVKNDQNEFKKLISLLPALYKNKFEELQATGSYLMELNLKGIYNDYEMPSYGVHLEIKDGSIKYPSLPEKISDINMSLHVTNPDGITDHTIIDLQKLHAQVARDIIDAKVKVTSPQSDAYIDADVKGKLNLGTLTQIIPMKDTKLSGLLAIDARAKGNAGKMKSKDYENLNASGNLVAQNVVYESKGSMPVNIEKASAQLSPLKVTLSECKATLNHTDIDAKGSVENFFGFMLRKEKIKGALTLNSKYFNANELMGNDANKSASDTTKLKPIKIPENIDFTLSSKIDKLIYDNYDISNFNGNIKVDGGILTFNNTSLEMLNAKFLLNGSYNSLNIQKPLVDLGFTIQQLDIQKAFKAFNTVKSLAPIAAFMEGMLNTTLHYNSALNENFMPVLSTIDSKGSLDILRASISGIKPLDMLADKLQLVNLKKFDLQKLLLNFAISDGQILIKPFTTKWNNYTMQLLEGVTSLDKSMNFHLKLSVPRTEFGAANTALNTMIAQANAKSPIPVKLGEMVDVDVFLTGSLLKPEISTNLRNIANKAFDDLKDALIKKTMDSLNNLKAMGATKAREEAMKSIAQAQTQADKMKADAAAYAADVKRRSYAAADSLVNSVQNPIAKIAAKATADRLKKDADAKTQQIVNDANAKADAIVVEAKRKAGVQ